MTIKPVEELYLSTKEGKSAGRMKLWIDDDYIAFVDEETGEERVIDITPEHDENLVVEIAGILAQYSRPLTIGFIRKTINVRADYKKTSDIEVGDILKTFLRDGIVKADTEMGMVQYYIA